MRALTQNLTAEEAAQLSEMEDRFFIRLTEDDKHLLYQVISLVNAAISEKKPLIFSSDFLEARTLVDEAKDNLRRFTCVRCAHECFVAELLDGEACPSCRLV